MRVREGALESPESQWHEQGELQHWSSLSTRIFVDWPWLDGIWTRLDSTRLGLNTTQSDPGTRLEDDVRVVVVFVAADTVPLVLLTTSTHSPTAIMDVYDPDKGKKGSCDRSGSEFVQPGDKDTYVQLVISLALGCTAFVAFCVCPVDSSQRHILPFER